MSEKRDFKRILTTIIAVFGFSVVAHGYRYVNTLFAGDSMLMIVQDDYLWQVSLGRFLQPLFLLLRGGLEAPLLIGVLAMLWIGASVYLVTKILDIKSIPGIVATAGVMVCNVVWTTANATFIGWTDLYAVALFLSVLAVYLINENKIYKSVIGVFCIIGTLATYQSYLFVTVGLMMFVLIRDFLDNEDIKANFIKALRFLGCGVVGGGLYYLLWKIALSILHLDAADSYNGISTVGDYTDSSIFGLIKFTYFKFFDFLFHPGRFIHPDMEGRFVGSVWPSLIIIANVVMFVGIIYMLVVFNMKRHNKALSIVMQSLLVLLLPFGLNGVAFISKGLLHHLMIYADIMIYVLFIAMVERFLRYLGDDTKSSDVKNKKLCTIITVSSLVLVGILVWNNIIYSNQIYLKRSLQENVVKTTMTNILNDIYDAEGYQPGVTPVAFYGDLENNNNISDIRGMENLYIYGMGKTPLSYQGTDYAYIKYYTGANINLIRAPYQLPEIVAMPQYPAEGSVDYIDGILVIKLSD